MRKVLLLCAIVMLSVATSASAEEYIEVYGSKINLFRSGELISLFDKYSDSLEQINKSNGMINTITKEIDVMSTPDNLKKFRSKFGKTELTLNTPTSTQDTYLVYYKDHYYTLTVTHYKGIAEGKNISYDFSLADKAVKESIDSQTRKGREPNF